MHLLKNVHLATGQCPIKMKVKFCLAFMLMLVIAGFHPEKNIPAKEVTVSFLRDKDILDKQINELSLLVNSPLGS